MTIKKKKTRKKQEYEQMNKEFMKNKKGEEGEGRKDSKERYI